MTPGRLAPDCLAHDRRGSAALEFALCFPAVLVFVFSLFAAYSLVSCWRAMDVGLERAMRAAAVNSGGGQAAAIDAYRTAAGVIWRDVGTASTLSVSPSSFPAGTDVLISASYVWGAPAVLGGSMANGLFTGFTLTNSAKIRVVN